MIVRKKQVIGFHTDIRCTCCGAHLSHTKPEMFFSQSPRPGIDIRVQPCSRCIKAAVKVQLAAKGIK